MRAKHTKTEVRKDQIAEAALAVADRHGVHNLSMTRIARRIGVVPSAIYRHFSSKDEVIEAVLQLIRKWLLYNVEAAKNERSHPLEQLEKILIKHVELLQQNHSIPRVVLSDEVCTGSTERRQLFYTVMNDYVKAVAAIVQQGQNEGSIIDSTPPDKIAVMFLGLIQPAAILWHLSDETFDATRQVHASWEIFARGIGTEE